MFANLLTVSNHALFPDDTWSPLLLITKYFQLTKLNERSCVPIFKQIRSRNIHFIFYQLDKYVQDQPMSLCHLDGFGLQVQAEGPGYAQLPFFSY